MPAILCPRCRKLISSDVPRCPFCGQARPGLWGATTWLRRLGLQVDFPHLITIAFVGLYVLALLLDPGAIFNVRGMMSLLAPSGEALFRLGSTGTAQVLRYDMWWTVITAIYLHGGLLHIFFNTMWVRQLGPLVEQLFGPWRLFVIFTVAGIVGFVCSAIVAPFAGLVIPFVGAYARSSVGASGSIFGLLAAAIVYGRRSGSTLFTRQFLQWAVILFIFGLVFPGVDNWAHGGGFVGGYVTAWLFSQRPGEREGVGTYLLAALCALLTIGAFALQFIAAISLFG